jgi:TolB-like protein/Flp pilus assembly protein TadD
MASQTEDLRDRPSAPVPRDRLDSWKEIAGYLNCSERTVRRWEEEGLPIHRHVHKSKAAIYAYKAEIDAWWRDGHESLKQIDELHEARPADSFAFWKRPWLVALLALAVFVSALVAWKPGGWRDRVSGRGSSPAIQSLAVLPLQNLSRDPEQEYFADGMTDALITDLARIGALKVISRTSSMQYKQTTKSLPQIARELNVEGIVEGTVQRSGDRVRITAQLIEASKDRHVWAESYERDLRDILRLQSEVARDIAAQIRVKLAANAQERLPKSRTVEPAVYEDYLKGRYYWSQRTEEGFRRAIDYFSEATQKDPSYALGYSGLADGYVLLGEYSLIPSKEAFSKARAAATKALELDETLADAHNALAAVREDYDWDWAGAEREFQRAIELNPGNATAHQWYAELLSELGRHEEALAEIKQAQQLDPFSLIIHAVTADVLRTAGEDDLSIEQLRKTLEMDPNFAHAYFHLGMAHLRKGAFAEAIAEFQRAATLSPNVTDYGGGLGYAYARAGQRVEARKILNQLKEQSKGRYVPWFYIAAIYAGLDEKEQAFACLENAYERREQGLAVIKREPMFDPLRSDPRYQALLRRMNLPVDSPGSRAGQN